MHCNNYKYPYKSNSIKRTSRVKSKSSAVRASLNAYSVGIKIVPLKSANSSRSPNYVMRSAWNGNALTKDSTRGRQHSAEGSKSAAFWSSCTGASDAVGCGAGNMTSGDSAIGAIEGAIAIAADSDGKCF